MRFCVTHTVQCSRWSPSFEARQIAEFCESCTGCFVPSLMIIGCIGQLLVTCLNVSPNSAAVRQPPPSIGVISLVMKNA